MEKPPTPAAQGIGGSFGRHLVDELLQRYDVALRIDEVIRDLAELRGSCRIVDEKLWAADCY